MHCERCNKNEATVQMQRMQNGQFENVNLCDECAGKMVVQDIIIPISFDHLFKGFFEQFFNVKTTPHSEKVYPDIRCPDCGISYEVFRKTGRIGCFNCYTVFGNALDEIFKNVQSGAEHHGKFPNRLGVDMKNSREAERLRGELATAIRNEEFEQAASLRDKIRSLGGNGHG